MRRAISIAILLVVSLFVSVGSAGAGVRQVGGWGYSSTNAYSGATAVRTTITQPALPQTTYDAPGVSFVYLWIGTYLADGSFYQAGYVTRDYDCPTKLRWFVWAFNPQGQTAVSKFGPCGLTGKNTFTLRQARLPMGEYVWVADMNGSSLSGSLFVPAARDIGTNLPNVVSETSRLTSALPNVNNQMGPVTYEPALQVRHDGIWKNVARAASYYWNAPCPPHNVYSNAYNRIRAGAPMTQYACYPDWTYLY
jgi:hypothetical protein